MTKIIAVIENLDDGYGGPSVSLPGLLSAISHECGVDVEIVSIRLKEDEVNSSLKDSDIIWDNKGKVFLSKKIMFSFGFSFSLIKRVNSESIVYINNLWNYVSFFSYLIAKIKGAKIIYAPRGSLYRWSISQRFLIKKIALFLFQKKFLIGADCVHVTANDEYDAVAALGVNANKIKVVPHGTELPSKNYLNLLDEATDRIINGVVLPKKYFLFFSRLHKKKGIDILLKIWRDISEDYPDWRLVIAGPDYGRYVESGMLSDVVYLGSVFGENKWSVIRRAGFVVLPSFTENFGVVIAESMAAGVPIITTNQTPWSVLNSSESGAWVPINEFEPKLREFLEFDQRKLDEMGVRARNVIEKEYSWKKRARQFYDDIYFPLIKAD